jgi:hypothetical protein
MPYNVPEKVALERLIDDISHSIPTKNSMALFYHKRDMDILQKFFPKLISFLKCQYNCGMFSCLAVKVFLFEVNVGPFYSTSKDISPQLLVWR